MKIKIGIILKFCAAVVLACAAATVAAAEKPIKFVVPFAPGGSSDMFARVLSQKMTESMGTPVYIENRPGSGGVIGLEYLLRNTGSESALGLLTTSSLFAALSQRPELVQELQMVSVLGVSGMVIVSSRDATIGDLVARAKRAPQLSFGSSGPGSVSHLCFEQFLKGAGRQSRAEHVPYRGTAPMIAELIGGQAETACLEISSALQHIRSGKLRALAVTLPYQHNQLPGIPTLESAGVQGVVSGSWYAAIAPKSTSRVALNSMAAGLKQALADTQVQARLRETMQIDPASANDINPEIADKFIQTQIARLTPYLYLFNEQTAIAGPTTTPSVATALSSPPALAIPQNKVTPTPSSASSSNATSMTCDGKCALLVAETKCKHIKDNRENLSCLIQNGTGSGDTPEICAQAKVLTGCKTKKEKEAENSVASKASRYGGKYDSVCERNFKKIDYVMQDKKISQAAATYDLFLRDINWYGAKVLEPCIGISAEAARLYKDGMDQYNRSRQYCAGPHPKYECTQWGASGGISDNGGNPFNNPAWYAAWKAEVDKALSDPNYSAELGSVTGSGAVNAADAACATSLKSLENQFAAARRDIPTNSVVVLSEASMWLAAESIGKIKAQCPQSEKYSAEVGRLQSQYRDLKRACDASASRTCAPRLPGKEPAPAPQAVAAPLPPLQGKPPASCDSQGGANFRKCMQEACAKQEGTLRGSTCLTCDFPSGAWTRCPPGSGGVSSNQ